jgi:hypothetical protein
MEKVITNPAIARKLLHLGNKIIDIKPNKKNENETVFVFNVDEKFKQDMDMILDK